MADIGSLSGFDSTNFNLGVGSTVSNGVLTVVPSGSGNYDGGIVTKAPYNIVGSSVYWRMNKSPGSTVDSHENFFGLTEVPGLNYGFGSAQNVLGWYLTGDQQTPGTGVWLQAVANNAGNDTSPSGGPLITCNPSSPLYIRIRETGGTTYWEYSANATTWTTQYSQANTITSTVMGSMYLGLDVGYWNSSDTAITQTFDKLNGGSGAPAGNPSAFFPFIR